MREIDKTIATFLLETLKGNKGYILIYNGKSHDICYLSNGLSHEQRLAILQEQEEREEEDEHGSKTYSPTNKVIN